MKTKPERLCPISKIPLPTNAHGNRKYHPVAEKEVKQINNERTNDRIRDPLKLLKRLDDILSKHYAHSNGTNSINKDILVREGFLWDCNLAITSLPDKSPIFWIIDYGYSFSDKKANNLKIHHGNNPIQQPDPAPGNAEKQ
jgi:hypothetical protein